MQCQKPNADECRQDPSEISTEWCASARQMLPECSIYKSSSLVQPAQLAPCSVDAVLVAVNTQKKKAEMT